LSIQEGVYVSKITSTKVERSFVEPVLEKIVEKKPELKIRRIETNRFKYRGKKLPWLNTKVSSRRLMAIVERK